MVTNKFSMSYVKSYLSNSESSSVLAVYRCLFGSLMFVSIIRFWYKGWIEELYLEPILHFSYYGFEWINPIGDFTYLLFFICAVSSFMVCVGWKYRFSIIILGAIYLP